MFGVSQVQKPYHASMNGFLTVLQPQADRNSRFTGAATAGPIMCPWKKACVADFPLQCPDYDYAQNVTIRAYCLKDGVQACKVVLVDEMVESAAGAVWEMQDGNCVVSFEKSADVVCVCK